MYNLLDKINHTKRKIRILKQVSNYGLDFDKYSKWLGIVVMKPFGTQKGK